MFKIEISFLWILAALFLIPGLVGGCQAYPTYDNFRDSMESETEHRKEIALATHPEASAAIVGATDVIVARQSNIQAQPLLPDGPGWLDVILSAFTGGGVWAVIQQFLFPSRMSKKLAVAAPAGESFPGEKSGGG